MAIVVIYTMYKVLDDADRMHIRHTSFSAQLLI